VYARTVEDAAASLRALRQESWGDLGLAGLSLALAVLATQARPELALPLFLGGLVVLVLGVRAAWRRWDLVERLAGEADAQVIAEVRAYAVRQAGMERRRSFASLVRSSLQRTGVYDEASLGTVADELEALAAELDDDSLTLDPVAAVACLRLVTDVAESPLLNPVLPCEDVRARVRQIRAGFRPAPLTAPSPGDGAPPRGAAASPM
jgi:hypothetical protein